MKEKNIEKGLYNINANHHSMKNGLIEVRKTFIKEIIIISLCSIGWIIFIYFFLFSINANLISTIFLLICAFLFPPLFIFIVSIKNYLYTRKGCIISSSAIILPDINIPFNQIETIYWNPNETYLIIILNSNHSLPNYPKSYYQIEKSQIFDKEEFFKLIEKYVNIKKDGTMTRHEIKMNR